jgi:hypothetical protein
MGEQRILTVSWIDGPVKGADVFPEAEPLYLLSVAVETAEAEGWRKVDGKLRVSGKSRIVSTLVGDAVVTEEFDCLRGDMVNHAYVMMEREV